MDRGTRAPEPIAERERRPLEQADPLEGGALHARPRLGLKPVGMSSRHFYSDL